MDEEELDLSRELSIKVIGNDGHVAVWARCKRDDIFNVIGHLIDLNGEADDQ